MRSSDLREARHFREPLPDGRNAAVAGGQHVDLGPISVQSPFNAAPPYADIMKHFGILAFAPALAFAAPLGVRSEEHTSELQTLMRISYAVVCWKQNNHSRLEICGTTGLVLYAILVCIYT